MKSAAGSGATSVLSRSGRSLKSVAVALAATLREGLAVEVGLVVAIVRQRRADTSTSGGGGGGPSRRKAGPSRRRGTSEQSPWRVAGFVLGTVGGLRGPQATPDLERLSIEQYRLMMADAQQERADALDAYQLAESAQREAGVASKLAAREQRDRWELLERFRRLETAQLGAPQVGGLSLEQRGLGSSRRQRRRRTSGGDA
ncbi:hypothetical protein PC121_g24133 [Phytophthora cactorum]|nr:hypothetical protein PC120_g26788 [Phytophthora cactorum]KAG3037125.1 hypothetical protein PC121_g24133 [Phytophthora cactorum]